MKTIKNIIKVIFSNITTIIAGVLVSFILPKIITVSDYGFYKVFSLYFNYLGVLSLGIIDGIVLKYGDKDYEQLEKEKLRAVFLLYSILHLFFVLALVGISFCFGSDYQFICLMLAATLLPVNVAGYFQQISQITQRFFEYSIRKIIQSICNVVFIVILFGLFYFGKYQISYYIYIYGTVAINLLLALWYVFTYRDIIFGKKISVQAAFIEVKDLVKLGVPLLVSNLCSTLLLSLDRQFVSILFSNEEYATYAFAYSMLSLVTVATSSISTVIYPLFKRFDKDKLISSYETISSIVLVFVFAIGLIYNPLCYFIEWFLPQYSESLLIFRIILPGVSLSSAITVVLHNYYKVLGYSFKFFILSVFALFISCAFNFVAYFIFKSREAISIASIISLFIWYLAVSVLISKECKFSVNNLIYILLMFASYYLSTVIIVHWLSLIVQICSFVLITFLMEFKNIRSIKNILKH